ncbi:hypothetical protein A3G67_03090 [Candidatus Roizmanbacteria bacterium RIFCSPLOWO2_12_FULL_40_12]|uniref:SnoaL-like domain-containing protein n=1 Tax=Candidatus Roizmanbacteria bacterium RIFCSPLOWO2_01_FULL_40_42 TaxID=1802066 RepID=A0A1F7J5C1_9BACT|nr:MAG: hypothetical protein A2779_02725 [Candidatus Roizmanbacteria bacterium RIFCSPHIGHO2_01_FULL_40_98]OGK28258.1 MAG: hypothetical protein A3C31_00090 [Candidatus Roizmanbacteria bacterium RIFCSPHIGHO2_02_FULL_40_53]OGK30494.1 MAG: hypothetical protein A2W49_02775 [Candidatus Roizmanbacteria bacterium RIFCSPHIGHO2_12_41_18]OGK36908.1 MAG: hypothetical protein A3E69_00350 [Candidatus Roizmanbacteria bacterium RIFCSPHIGHO2_12_FULL_40_130]OGK50814.1 MAG: hypothetical protein A3B50_00860 [Candi
MIIDKYFVAFGNKDILTIESLLADNIVLHDPSLGIIRGKKKVLQATQNIFNLGDIRLKIRSRIRDNERSAVEFILTIKNKTGYTQEIHGVDIFLEENDKIISIKAFITIIN